LKDEEFFVQSFGREGFGLGVCGVGFDELNKFLNNNSSNRLQLSHLLLVGKRATLFQVNVKYQEVEVQHIVTLQSTHSKGALNKLPKVQVVLQIAKFLPFQLLYYQHANNFQCLVIFQWNFRLGPEQKLT
jgi:hypothetical protein